MAYPRYLREKACELRLERHLSIDEIAERLALPRTTIYYWVRQLPLGRPRRNVGHPGSRGMRAKYKRLREEAYEAGRDEFVVLASDLGFRDFVCLYLGEGYKRCRNTVAICNSNPTIVRLGAVWACRLTTNKVRYSVQYHADQRLSELNRFWGELLDLDPDRINFQRKSNSNGLAGRTWRSKHGVLTVSVGDTYLRARLQAWMDIVQESWA